MKSRILVYSIFSLLFAISPNAQAGTKLNATWELHDVSILFPLPEVNNWDLLISPKSQENLLPLDVFQKIPYLINQENALTYPDLRVVGVRIDPCFTEGPGPVACQKQVRFIWQPLTIASGVTSTIDASLHVFFTFNDQEFLALLNQLVELKKISGEVDFTYAPLGVHPVLKQLGLGSSYAVQLKNIFLAAVKNKKMNRITFMKLKGMDDMWFFGGIDFKENSHSEIQIPLLSGAKQQDFINEMAIRPPALQFLGGIFPAANEESTLALIAKDSAGLEDYSEEQIKNMIREIATFENPKNHNPGTLDCVGCHLAGTMREWANIHFSPFQLPAEYEKHRYQNAVYNLTNTNQIPGRTNVLRMFGYFENQPITAQRLINESAEVAGALSRAEASTARK